MGKAKKKNKPPKAWNRTGVGATIRLESELIDGTLCARLATKKSNACRMSLYYDYNGEQFLSIVTTITGGVLVEKLPDLEHAQLVYNRLPRRVHPDRLESIGITNPLDADLDDLEDELITEFRRAV